MNFRVEALTKAGRRGDLFPCYVKYFKLAHSWRRGDFRGNNSDPFVLRLKDQDMFSSWLRGPGRGSVEKRSRPQG